jgi:hypothetical protein
LLVGSFEVSPPGRIEVSLVRQPRFVTTISGVFQKQQRLESGKVVVPGNLLQPIISSKRKPPAKSEKHLKDFPQFPPFLANRAKTRVLKINDLCAGVCWNRQRLGFESLRLRSCWQRA